jgi:tellurite resistance protein TerC
LLNILHNMNPLIIFLIMYVPGFLFDYNFKKGHDLTIKESVFWSLFWTAYGLLFGLILWYISGHVAATEYWTAFVTEKSLSIDNLFVFTVIFEQFAIKGLQQQTALSYGILGAIVFRIILLTIGTFLLTYAGWLMYPLAGLLVYLAYKILFGDGESDPKGLELAKRLGLSPFWAAVGVIELNDLIFAADSIPAVLAISSKPLVVITSNIAAIQSLRSIYFVLSALKDKLCYLSKGIGIVLALIGLKMLALKVAVDMFKIDFHIDTGLWLLLIVSILGASVLLSVFKKEET